MNSGDKKQLDDARNIEKVWIKWEITTKKKLQGERRNEIIN